MTGNGTETGRLYDVRIPIRPPTMEALAAHLPPYWAETVTQQGIRAIPHTTYLANASSSEGLAASRADSALVATPEDLLATYPWIERLDLGLLTVDLGLDAFHNPDFAAAVARALNEWILTTWLSESSRLAGSISVPVRDAPKAVAEIDHFGREPRYIAVTLPVRTPTPLGNRHHWPIYEAAERHGLLVVVSPNAGMGSSPTPVGMPGSYAEDYANLAEVYQSQLVSLVTEGVFQQFPRLRVVLLASGFTWLPSLMWRLDKNWKGLRREVPWVQQRPSEILRRHVRISIQPLDLPTAPEEREACLQEFDIDEMLLFASEHPFTGEAWEFTNERPASTRRRILHDNFADLVRPRPMGASQ